MNSVKDHRDDIFQDGGAQGILDVGTIALNRVSHSSHLFPMVKGRKSRGFTCARIHVTHV